MTYQSINSVNWSLGIQELPKYINDITNGVFSNLLLLGIFMIFASGYWIAKRDILAGFAVAGFITWIFALLMWIGDFTSGVTLGICTAVMFLSFAGLFLPRGEE